MRRLAAVTAAVLVLSGFSVVLAQSAAAAGTGETFVSVPSARIVDTRTGVGAPKRAVAAHGLLSPTVAGTGHAVPSTAAAVQVTITTVSPTASGGITAYGPAPRPGTTNVQFITGHGESGSALVQLTAGKINLYNAAASGTVQIVVDLTGYWAPTASSTAPGVLHPVAPARVVDTRYGTGGVAKKAIAAHQAVTAALAGSGKPAPSGTGAVAVTITAVGPTTAGGLIVYAGGATPPTQVTQYFTAQRGVSTFAVVPLSSAGTMSVYNSSGGTVNVVVDLAGYYVAGVPVDAGALQPVTPERAMDRSGIKSASTLTVHLGGVGGVPRAANTVAVVTVSVIGPTGGGGVTAWQTGKSRPGVTTVQYLAGQNVSATALVPVSSAGDISLYNASSGTERLLVDIDGYLPATTIPPSAASVARYPNDLVDGTTDAQYLAHDTSLMQSHGCDDAHAGAAFVLLDLGAQSITGPQLDGAHPGIAIAQTAGPTRLTLTELETIINGYLAGFGTCKAAGATATIAVGTSNDGDWVNYPASIRGANFATDLINQLTAPAGLDVVGAIDIEAAFASTEAEAEQWEEGYLQNTSKKLIYNGDANDCPTTFGVTGATCAYGWTQAQYYKLAHNAGRVQVLPQIYYPSEATKWANIDATGDATGSGALDFLGSLTEHALAPAELTPVQGRAALYRAVSTLMTTPSIPFAPDIVKDVA